MKKSNFALRLQPALLEEVRRLAKAEGVAVNQLINVAVAEKLSALRTEQYFAERAARRRRPGGTPNPGAGGRRPAARAGRRECRSAERPTSPHRALRPGIHAGSGSASCAATSMRRRRQGRDLRRPRISASESVTFLPLKTLHFRPLTALHSCPWPGHRARTRRGRPHASSSPRRTVTACPESRTRSPATATFTSPRAPTPAKP